MTATDLARPESARLAECEETIERGMGAFVEVGLALAEVRDARLYRAEFDTFEAYCRERWGMSRSYAHRQIDAAEVVGMLPIGNGDGPANEAQARELSPLKDDEAELVNTWRELRAEHGDSLTAAKVQEAVSMRMRTERAAGSSFFTQPTRQGYSDEWYTPAEPIDAVREVLGGIDLDPASCELANKVVRAAQFYSQADDGLSQQWTGRVFLNPPYSEARRFVEKLLASYADGTVSAAVVLLNTTSVHAKHCWPLFDFPLCFTRGRIQFTRPDPELESRPPTGSFFAYLGPDEDRFARIFSQFGAVLSRHPMCEEVAA